jgi:hypothetical protein
MVDGVNGTLLTANVFAPEIPQVLEAFTVTLPVVNKLLLIAVAMVVVVEVPVNPVGKVHKYCVAPVEAELV